jgi:Nucleotidyl transferase AbiEii toxin, Type IV TA system
MQETLRRIIEAAETRKLPFLLIGGNALILLGYIRNTVDIDLLVESEKRSKWLDLMREFGLHFLHETGAFVQFEPAEPGDPGIDLMFVDAVTWEKLLESSRKDQAAGHEVRMPKPEHLVALKLHAASSPTRSKPETDWEDVRQIVRICRLDIADPEFREIVRRYGGEEAVLE